jgi:two-component system chemotaxis response regulator CheB
MSKIKVLVCDDSALMRRQLTQLIESDSELLVIGAARDGLDALDKARALSPDVITMDINMPGIDGITALQIINEEEIAPVIMVSSLTQRGAETTVEAMLLGAFDFVAKPSGTVSADMSIVARELIRKIKAATVNGTLSRITREPDNAQKRFIETQQRESRVQKRRQSGTEGVSGIGFKAVAIGISTGGPKTLMQVLPYLPPTLHAAVFVVQHMPPTFTNSFARRINDNSQMKCCESEAGMTVEPGTIYLAKGGYHMGLYQERSGKISIRASRTPSHAFVPSVDVMMASVLDVFGADTVGVLMTGMGDDGADSMVKIREADGVTIAESEESAIVFGMPQEAIRRGGAETVLPSWGIADAIIRAVR